MKIHYFNLYGRAEPMRMLLNHKGVAFEENVVTFAVWPEQKASMVGKFLPNIELDDGTKFAQSSSMLRYLGRTHGYYSEDALEALNIDMVSEFAGDVLSVIYKPHFAKEEDRPAMVKGIVEESLPKLLEVIADRLAAGSWMVGGRLTIADFMVGQIYTNYLANPHIVYGKEEFAAFLEANPTFKAFGERFALENKAHLDSRPAYGI